MSADSVEPWIERTSGAANHRGSACWGGVIERESQSARIVKWEQYCTEEVDTVS